MLQDQLHRDPDRASSGPVGDSAASGPDGLDFLPDLLAALTADGLSDREIVDQLAVLERLTSSAAAAKAALTSELHRQRRISDAEAGAPTRRCGRGVAHEVALARRESPHLARQHVALARALTTEMPAALAALRRGDLNEDQAMILVRETADLSPEQRQRADATLGHRYGTLGTRELTLAARRIAVELDPVGAEERARRACERGGVTMRGIGDGMARITGQVPAEEAITAMQSMREFADARRAMGDERTRDQIVADTFTDRLNRSLLEPAGATSPGADHEDGAAPARGVEVQLVMSAEMLLGADRTTPAHLRGHGPLPMGIAADLLADPDLRVMIDGSSPTRTTTR
ncbi:DUF222 domain-containing protein [Nocardioides sp. AE5]|uniref:DUF222 domain-containing protein n=1 Tax=Nocardioides sp. AE5 TaxID=2962573 RepID=UPI0028815D2D|nr:DUF222 domain-containing protein [Nocardioides sp. AE5]MDT0201795.1 DUF222 domain-containing protein [Nocardioides sp. AE5]